jgi:ABC-type uncharacterized transport system auxiliary subunit
MNRRREAWVALCAGVALSGCINIGNDAARHTHYMLYDAAKATPRATPVVSIPSSLLIQVMPGDPFAETLAIAYARNAHERAVYQLASWAERPVRQVPRLLQRRLEARRSAAVALLGDPVRTDWLLALTIDAIYHDATTLPGLGRVALTAELIDRRGRSRVARRSFEARAPLTQADSAAACEAISHALTQVFDALVPWLETELQQAVAAAPSS